VSSPGSAVSLEARLEQHWILVELQLEALRPALLVTAAVAFLVLGYIALVAEVVDLRAFLVALALLISVGAAASITSRHPYAAARTLVAGIAASVALAFGLRPSLGVAAMFTPVVVLAACRRE